MVNELILFPSQIYKKTRIDLRVLLLHVTLHSGAAGVKRALASVQRPSRQSINLLFDANTNAHKPQYDHGGL